MSTTFTTLPKLQGVNGKKQNDISSRSIWKLINLVMDTILAQQH